MSNSMTVIGIYAGVAVGDFDGALAWYGKLMGRAPDDRPMNTMAQWRNMGGAGLQLWHEPERAGQSIITIVVDDMAAERQRLADEGIALAPDTSGDFGIIVQLIDPEGNRITLAEPPKGFVSR